MNKKSGKSPKTDPSINSPVLAGGRNLRQRAEKKLGARKKTEQPLTEVETQRLVHELEVHQVELEMQNEELTRSRTEVESLLEQFTDLYDFAPIGYFTLTWDAAILQANLAGAKLLGLERSKLIKCHFGLFIANGSRLVFNSLLEKACKSHEKENCDVLLKNAGPEITWLHIEAICSKSGQECQIAAIDITERKRAEEALKTSEARYRTLVENMNDVVMEVDAQGNFCYVSPNYETLAGYSLEEELGSPGFAHVHPEDQVMLLQKLGKALESKQTLAYRVQHKNGEWLWIETSGKPYRTEDGSLHVISVARDITERKQAEEVLNKTRILLSETEKMGQVGGWEFNIDTGKQLWTEEIYHIHEVDLDYDPTVERGIQFYTPASRLVIERAVQRAVEQGEPFDLELEIITAKGNLRLVHAIGKADLEHRRVFGFFHDITMRKQAEKALRLSEQTARQTAEQLQMINQIGIKITSGLDFDQLMQTTYEQCQQIGDTDTFYIALYDNTTGMVSFPFNCKDGKRRVLASRNIREKPGLVGYVIEHRQTFFINNEANIPASITVYKQPGILSRSYITVPLILNERVVGVISVQSHAPNAYSTEQVQTLELLAVQVAIAVQNAQLYQRAREEIAERKQAEAALHESEANLRALLDAIMESVLLIKPDGSIIAINTTTAERLHNTVDQMIGRNIYDFLAPAVAEARRKYAEQVIATGQPVWFEDQRFERAIFNSITPILDASGCVDRLAIFGFDITARKQAEETIQESEKRFATIFRSNPAAIAITRLDNGQLVDVNEAWQDVTGYTRAEVLSHTPGELNLWVNIEQRSRLIEMVREQGKARGEMQLRCKSGEVHDLLMSAEQIELAGVSYLVTMAQDITERMQAEEKMRESNELLSQFLKYSPIYAFVKDVTPTESRVLKASENYRDMIGIPGSEMVGKTMQELFPADSAAKFTADDWAVVSSGKVLKLDEDFGDCHYTTIKFPIIQGDKSLLAGYTIDITERKHAEETLRETKELYQALFDQSADAVFLLDLEGRYVQANQCAADMLGYTREEILKLSVRDLFAELESSQNVLTDLIEGKTIPTYEHLFRKKNGDLIHVEPHVTLIRDHEGRPYRIQSIVRDITERKRAEDALRESEALYRLAIETAGAVPYREVYPDPDEEHIEYQFIGDGIRKITGYGPEEFNARLWEQLTLEVYPQEDLAGYPMEEAVQRVRAGRHPIWKCDFKIRARDGSIHWVFESAVELRDELGISHGSIGMYQDITERKLAEEKLQNSEAFLNRMIEQGPLAMWISDEQGTLIRINQACCDLLKITPGEVVGRYNIFQDNIVIEQGFLLLVKAVFERGETAHFELIYDSSQVQGLALERTVLVILEVTIFPVKDTHGRITNAVIQHNNITFRKQAEAEVRLRSEELAALNTVGRNVNASLSLGVTTTAALNGFMNAVRPDVAYIFLREGQDLILKETLAQTGVRVPEGIPTHRVGECMCGLAVQEKKAFFSRDIYNDWRCTWDECKKAGLKSFAALPLYGGEDVIGVIGLASFTERNFEQQAEFLETLTNQVSAALVNARLFETIQEYAADLEQRVEERTRELRDAQEKLVRQERLVVLGQLAGGVGHELRTPLSVINNAVYFLRMVQPEADEKVKEYIGIIESETHNADKIINDLLDFSRIKSVDSEPLVVAETVRYVLDRYPVPEGISVSLSLPETLPRAYADPRQVGQVLGNLVVNACQAMKDGGKLEISAKRTRVAGKPFVAIAVKDTGVGIPPENMEKIFEPLFTTKAKGIGLGLAVSRKLAEANGGKIEVQSEPGKGSTFTVYLSVEGKPGSQPA
jgi:PAS domain S-box-containing protein